MQTLHFTKVKIQDTPIKTIRLEWRAYITSLTCSSDAPIPEIFGA